MGCRGCAPSWPTSKRWARRTHCLYTSAHGLCSPCPVAGHTQPSNNNFAESMPRTRAFRSTYKFAVFISHHCPSFQCWKMKMLLFHVGIQGAKIKNLCFLSIHKPRTSLDNRLANGQTQMDSNTPTCKLASAQTRQRTYKPDLGSVDLGRSRTETWLPRT